jgi:hypothetical protein
VTWTKINEGLRTRAVTGLSISTDGQVLYVATNGEGVFRLDIGGVPPAPPAESIFDSEGADLNAGWNHTCYTGAEAPIESALASIVDKTSVVYSMRPDQGYDRWFPGRPEVSTISTLSPYDALLILTSSAASWSQASAGSEPDSVDLVEEAITSISGDFGILYAIGENQAWRRFVPGRPEVSNLSQLEHCQAVLALVTREGGTSWQFEP